MLVLSRKKGEVIVIGGDICISVIGVRGDCVRLGFVAPKEIPILRAELHDGHASLCRKQASAATQGVA